MKSLIPLKRAQAKRNSTRASVPRVFPCLNHPQPKPVKVFSFNDNQSWRRSRFHTDSYTPSIRRTERASMHRMINDE